MTLKTNFNSAPYYDDFDPSDNFHRVLFRPGYAIQARELSQLQSILQDQIEKHGSHVFKDGAIVVPGETQFNNAYQSVRLNASFNGESIDPAQYYNSDDPVLLTGETSGVTAQVIGYAAAGDAATEPLLYLNYVSSGKSGSAGLNEEDSQQFFENGENISADIGITHTTSYAAGANSTSVFQPTDPDDDACSFGSAFHINAGVFYIKGTFVETTSQTLVLSYNDAFPSAKIGFKITEEIVTPESDTTLLDNATGTSNYAAKGAHRLKIVLTLAKKTIDDATDDQDFVELMRVVDGNPVEKATASQYNVLGEMLAKRTYEESGDYVVEPYRLDVTECVDNFVGGELFLGEYEPNTRTDDFVNAQDDLLALHIQPGSAYVRGFRQENIGIVRKDLAKARDTLTVDAGSTDFEIGNYLRLTNVYGTPDIGDISDETTPYKPILLWDKENETRGGTVTGGNAVGVLRCRAFQHEQDGKVGAGSSSTNADSVYRLYAFDVRNFVKLTMSGFPSPTVTANFSSGGVQVTGVTSGATGFIFNDTTSFPDNSFSGGTTTFIYLTNVIGEFSSGEKIKVSDGGESNLIVEDSSNVDLTISDIVVNKLSDARQVQMQEADSGQDFTADIVLDELEPGKSSGFSDESTGTGSTDSAIGVALEEDGSEKLALQTLKGARLRDPEKLQSIFKMPKDVIKTLLTEDNNAISQTELTFRKQFIGTTNSAGVVTFSAGANETFVDFAESDYTLSILTAGGGTGSQGDLVSISGNTAGHNTATLTITDNTVLGSSAKVKFIGTIKKTAVTQALKTTNLSKQLKVIASDADGAYGTRATDKDISLGRTDVYRIQAVYDSQDTSTDAVAPTLTVSDISGTFERGERIKGQTTGARGRLVTTSSPLTFTQLFGDGSTQFEEGESIIGEFSGATATIDTDGITVGSSVVTDSFEFDDGQRNNYYDISRLIRKSGVSAPTGRLLVIYDYLSHGSGNFFSVDSYSSVAGQMQYDNIPTFIATTVDPDDPAPASEFPLADCLDFRPTVENITGTSETITAVDQVTANSFDFFSRQYDGTGAVVLDTLKPDSSIVSDFEFYIPKTICLYLTADGEFEILESEAAENPTNPAGLSESMKIADFILPAYTFSPDDVSVIYQDNSRYTMRDIGDLEQRIDSLEYYTSLTLLESQTKSLEILDANGLNRFKSGFVVDPFVGHGVGAQRNPDYDCAVDPAKRELRPLTVDKSIDLKLLLNSGTERAAAGYRVTDNLVTLPYTVSTVLNNTFTIPKEKETTTTTTTTVDPPNGTPLPDREYIGNFTTFTPDEDSWFETETQKLKQVKKTDQYDEAVRKNGGQVTATTYGGWNNVGNPYSNESYSQAYTGGYSGHINRKGGASRWLYQFRYWQKQQRTKTVKKVSYKWQYETKTTQGQTRPILYCRPRTIKFTCEGLKPNTNHYPFFNNKPVKKYSGPLEKRFMAIQANWVTPSNEDVDVGDSEDISNYRKSPNQNRTMRSNGKGKIRGFFMIPDHRGKNKQDVPKFPTGGCDFILTSNKNNEKGIVASSAKATYTAAGNLRTYTSQVIATKKPKKTVKTSVHATKTVKSMVYKFGGKNLSGFRPSAEWQDYYEGKTDNWVRTNIQNYIKQGILERRGNKIRINPAYRAKSPIAYTRDSAQKQGLTVSQTDAYYQTFYATNFTGDGYFARRLVLYFTKKSKVDVCNISIVTVEDGLPTDTVLPYSNVTLEPDAVNAAEDGKTFTRVNFTAPVYLQSGGHYAIRINSKDNAYIPYIGSERKGNAKNVAVDQMYFPTSGANLEGGTFDSHMRFNIQCCLFDPEVEGNVTLRNRFTGELVNKENGRATYAKKLIVPNPLEFTHSISKVKVFHQNHGMYSTSNNVQLTGVVSGVTTTLNGSITDTSTKLVLKSFAGFSSGSTHAGSGTIRVKIDNELFAGTLSGNTLTVSGRGTTGYGTTSGASVAHADGATVELYMLYGVPLNEINKNHTSIADIEMDSYTIALSTAPTVTGSVTTIRNGGTEVFATENYRIDLMKTYTPTLELPGTAISAKVRTTSATSPGGSETPFTTTTEAKALPIALNQEYQFETARMVASRLNEVNEMDSNHSFFLDLVFKTDNTYLSPVLDLTDPTVMCIGNRFGNVDSASDVYTPTGSDSNYVPHTEPVGDSDTAIYLTKPVQLENTATAIKLFLDVHKPATSEVKALFRVLPAEGEDDIKNIPFTLFNGNGLPDIGVATTAQDSEDFVEYKYTAGVNDFGAGVELQDFQQYQIKLVMQGTNSAKPPRIMNLRGIALAT